VRVHVTQVDWNSHRDALRGVREQVFIVEQRVPKALEWDGEDDHAHHFIALNEAGQALGCARLLPSGQIGRMAVLPSYRGTGLGARLLQATIEHAKTLGMERVFLHAQRQAEPFYRKAGFLQEGGEFMEAGIPHVPMALALPIPFRAGDAPAAVLIRPAPDIGPLPDADLLRFAGELDCRQGLEACLSEPRRRLAILSQQLDHVLFDHPGVVEAMSAFARSAPAVQVRILISDSSLVVSRGHRLLELARRLDSRMEIRKVPEELAPTETSFVTWDEQGYFLMPDFRQYLASANRYDPVHARRLADQFAGLWARSASDPELRVLRL
jgi:predicted GNAT family N-acyltransferase